MPPAPAALPPEQSGSRGLSLSRKGIWQELPETVATAPVALKGRFRWLQTTGKAGKAGSSATENLAFLLFADLIRTDWAVNLEQESTSCAGSPFPRVANEQSPNQLSPLSCQPPCQSTSGAIRTFGVYPLRTTHSARTADGYCSHTGCSHGRPRDAIRRLLESITTIAKAIQHGALGRGDCLTGNVSHRADTVHHVPFVAETTDSSATDSSGQSTGQ